MFENFLADLFKVNGAACVTVILVRFCPHSAGVFLTCFLICWRFFWMTFKKAKSCVNNSWLHWILINWVQLQQFLMKKKRADLSLLSQWQFFLTFLAKETEYSKQIEMKGIVKLFWQEKKLVQFFLWIYLKLYRIIEFVSMSTENWQNSV